MTNVKRQRTIVQTGLAFGTVASIAFNIMGTQLVTDSIAAQVMSTVWSLFALVTVDILVKVKTPTGKHAATWRKVKFGGVGFVAAVSMASSYMHGFHTMQSWNSGVVASLLGPIAVDGMMILCGVMLLAIPAPVRKRKPAAKPTRRLKVA
jgi:hypothetical protein